MLQGYTVDDIAHAYIFAEVTSKNIADIICVEFDEVAVAGMSNSKQITDICKFYKVSPHVLLNYVKQESLTVQELFDMLIQYQKAHNMFIQNRNISKARSASSEEVDLNIAAPFTYLDNKQENINLNTGELSYTEDIVSLKGKNGMDLDLKLRYDSGEAELNNISVNEYPIWGSIPYWNVWEYKQRHAPNGYHKQEYNKNTFLYKCYDKAVAEWIASIYRSENPAREPYGDGVDEWWNFYGLVESSELGVVDSYYSKVYTPKSSHSTFGVGWKLNPSSIETVNGNKIFKMSDGGSKKINGYGSTNPSFDKYTKLDVLISKDDQTFSSGGKSSTHLVTYKDGKREYFDTNGLLIGIKDKFDNTIRFEYTDFDGQQVLSKIIDTAGRVITITNTLTSDGKATTFTLPDNNTVVFTQNKLNGYSKAYTLTQKKDQKNNVTSYNHNLADNNFINLTKVAHPTGGENIYEYYSLNYVSGGV